MSFTHLFARTLWVLPLILQAAIALVIWRRGLVRVFPLFFAYTVTVFSREVALLFLRYPGNRYAIVYWCGEALAVLLGLGVILETLKRVLPPSGFTRTLLRLMWVVGTVVAAISATLLVMAKGAVGSDPAFEFIILLERSARFLQVSLLVVVIALIWRLGLTWHHYSVGIVAGFGVYSALALVLLEFRAHLHVVGDTILVLLNSVAYNVGVVIWAFYFLRPWRVAPLEQLPPIDLTEWSKAVSAYVDQWYRRY